MKQTTVYPRKSSVPSKPKTVAFNYDKVGQPRPAPPPGPLPHPPTRSHTTCTQIDASTHKSDWISPSHIPSPWVSSSPGPFTHPQDILCKIEYDDESVALLPAGTDKTLGVRETGAGA